MEARLTASTSHMRVFNRLSNPAVAAPRAFKVANKVKAAPATIAQDNPAQMPILTAMPGRRERDTHAVPKPASRARNNAVKSCEFAGEKPNNPLSIKLWNSIATNPVAVPAVRAIKWALSVMSDWAEPDITRGLTQGLGDDKRRHHQQAKS